MDANLKYAYVQEVKYQMKMLRHLKRWLQALITFSSISLIFILYGPSLHSVVRPIFIVIMILSILCTIVVGLGLKNGKANLFKIMQQYDKTKII